MYVKSNGSSMCHAKWDPPLSSKMLTRLHVTINIQYTCITIILYRLTFAATNVSGIALLPVLLRHSGQCEADAQADNDGI